MKSLITILTVVAALYAGVCLLVYSVQDSLLFFPGPNDKRAVDSLRGKEWFVASAETSNMRAPKRRTSGYSGNNALGEAISAQDPNTNTHHLHGWLIASPGASQAPLVLYFGGNAQDIALQAAATVSSANYLFVNYRGYGRSHGRPSERALKADALRVYDQAVEEIPHNGKVIAHGRSLGSGVAVYLAAHRKIDGIILVTPYDSITQVARKHYPWLPVRWLLKHHFDSASLAPNLTPPALFLLADRDTIIPVTHSEALAALWGGPLELHRFPEATHNSIGISDEFKNYIQEFLKQF